MPTVLLAISLGLNVWQGWHLRTAHSLGSQTAVGVAEGTELPEIPVLTLSGEPTTLRFDGAQPTLVYVLSPTCAWCKRNHDNAVALAAQTQGRYRFVALAIDGSLDQLKEYVRTQGIPFELVLLNSQPLVNKLGLGATPQTFVAADSRVEKSWYGAYGGTHVEEIQQVFGVKLPGVRF